MKLFEHSKIDYLPVGHSEVVAELPAGWKFQPYLGGEFGPYNDGRVVKRGEVISPDGARYRAEFFALRGKTQYTVDVY